MLVTILLNDSVISESSVSNLSELSAFLNAGLLSQPGSYAVVSDGTGTYRAITVQDQETGKRVVILGM